MNEIEIPPKINYEDKLIQIGKIKLNYWEEGNGPETLFFIHGFTGNVEEWYFQFFHFEKKYRVIAIDLRGHGKSEIEDKEINADDLINDIDGFLEKKGISKINLIGHSMGGMIAQYFTLKYPEKVEKLVLISTTSGGPQRKIPESYIKFIKSTTVDNLIDIMSRSASIPLKKMKPERREFYKKLQKWSVERRSKAISINTYIRYLQTSSKINLRNRINEIKVPTLILYGDKDRLVAKTNSEFLREHIANSNLIMFPDCGHAPQREYFIEFNNYLSQFLEEE